MAFRVPRLPRVLAALVALLLPAGLRAQTLFPQPSVVKTGNWPAAVYSADVNGDGIPDLIYLDHGATAAAATAHVLVGDGKGGFTQTAVIATAGTSLAIGDFDGDGRLDVGWATTIQGTCNGFGFSGTTLLQVYFAFGNGLGGFGAATPLSNLGGIPTTNCAVPQLGTMTAARTFAGTGPEVLVFEDTANGVLNTYFEGHTPVFGTNALLVDGSGPMTIADVNGDGLGDAVIANLGTGVIDVYLSLGTGHFAAPKSFHAPGSVLGVKVQEVDNDTYPDLVIEGANGRFDIYHGNGDGTFSTQSEGGSGTLDGTTGNGGQLAGITTLANGTRHNFITATPAGVSVLVGQGNLTYVQKGIYNAGPGRSSYALADFNGDGYPDLAVDSPEGIAILYGNADGSFQSSQAYAAGQPAESGALGAFTSSGNLDAVVGTPQLGAQMMLGQGDGSFVPVGGANSPQPTFVSSTPASGVWGQVLAGDFDGDGTLDVAMTVDGPWQNSGSPSLPTYAASGLWAQFNLGHNDGRLGPATAVPYFNASTGQGGAPYAWFGTGTTGAFGGKGVAARIANLNGSRLQVLNGLNNAQTIGLTLGFSDANDGIGVAYDGDVHAHDQTVSGDLNGDGADDLIVQHNGLLTVYLSLKNSQFQKLATTVPVAPYVSSTWGGVSQTYNEPAFPGSMAIADLNGDGFGDLVVAYDDIGADHTQPTASRPNHILIWLGNGDGTFHGPTTIVPSRNFYQIALADLNGDGHPDLVMHDGYVLSVQYGKGDGTFGTEVHYLAGMGLNTILAGDVNHDGKVDLVVANGGTVFGNPVANHEAPVANPGVAGGGVTVMLNAAAPALSVPTGTLTATPNPVAFAGAFSVTITLNGTPAPTGSVVFTIDGQPAGGSTSGSVALTNGALTLSFPASSFTNPLTPGAHALVAVYGGDANYPGVTLSATLTVGLAPTSVLLTPSTALTVFYGQGIDGTFAIISTYTQTGTFTVLDNGVATAICTNLPITTNGAPTDCPYGNPVLLDAGPHALQVAYNGDSQNAASVSPAIAYVVLPDTTVATLGAAPNPAGLGQSVELTATLVGNVAVPVGPVVFLDGANVLGTATLNAAGVATLAISTLSVGTHTITASYAGTIDFNAAVSNAVAVQVKEVTAPQTTAIQLTSSLNPAPKGLAVTLTATVVSSGVFAVTPAGSVSFLDGAIVLGTATLDGLGVARFSTTNLAVGTHALTASYAGEAGSAGVVSPRASGTAGAAGLAASVSPVLSEVITTPLVMLPPGFNLTVTPDPVSVPAGQNAVLAVKVLVVGNFTQTIQLGCTGLPAEASCVFATPVVSSAGGTSTLYVLPQGPHSCTNPSTPYYGWLLPLGGLGLMAVRRRRLRGWIACVVLAGLAGLSGCGNCTDLGVIPGNYNFVVTGTPVGGPVTQAQGWTVGMKVTLP